MTSQRSSAGRTAASVGRRRGAASGPRLGIAAEHDGLGHPEREERCPPAAARPPPPGPAPRRVHPPSGLPSTSDLPAPEEAIRRARAPGCVLPLPLGPTTATSSARRPRQLTPSSASGAAPIPHRNLPSLEITRGSAGAGAAKRGTPTSAVITPTGSSSGRTTVRETTSASTRKQPPPAKTSGQERPMQRPRDGPHRVGHDQSDEADDAAGGHAGGGEQRGQR